MIERTPLGYCTDCPVAAWLNIHTEVYIADTPYSGIDESSVEILSVPSDLSEEDINDAAKAFSMSDRVAIRLGVSDANIDQMKIDLSESYTMLGQCAIESDCQGKIVTDGASDRCPATGAQAVFERMIKAYEINILGYES